MNESFLARLKKDRTLQLIVFGGGIGLILILFMIGSLFSGGKKQSKQVLPCYKTTLTIWAPFDEYQIRHFFQGFTNRCVSFNYQEMPFEQILTLLPRALVQQQVPDIVFVDRFHLLQFRDLFQKAPDSWIQGSLSYLKKEEIKWFQPWLGVPFFVDAVVPIYLQTYLESAGFLEPPETFDDLSQLIQKLKVTDQAGNIIFAPIALGSLNEKRLAETILALASLEVNYLDSDELSKALPKAIEFYLSYSDPTKENYVYPAEWPKGENSLLNRKTAGILGFYQDVISLRDQDPRINLILGKFYRKKENPKRANFTQIYYFGVIKTKNVKASWDFLGWLYRNHLLDLAETFSMVPATVQKMDKLTPEKKVVLEEAVIGDPFDFVDLDSFRSNIREILQVWQKNPVDGQKLFSTLKPTILPFKPEWLK